MALASFPVLGSGFGLNEHGAKAMGMAGAYTAVADTPEAVFFNPAGLATLRGFQIEGGVTMVAPSAAYTGLVPGTNTEATVKANQLFFWLPSFHASYRIHDRLAAGIGVYVPFGLTMEWPTTVTVNGANMGWWGRSIIERISLETVFFTPTVAVKLHDRISLGAGLAISKAAVSLKRAVSLSADPQDDVTIDLSGGDVGIGATAGLLVKVIPDLLNAGLTFRSGVKYTFDGTAAFTKNGSGAAVPAGLRTQLTDGPGQASVTLPHVFSFGLAAFPIKPLTLGFAFDVISWSSYDKLDVVFRDNPDLNATSPKLWNNSIVIRVGAEYRVTPNIPLRLGFIFDQGPTPATTRGPDLPDADRYEVTVGGGYQFRGFRVDLAYQYLTTGDAEATDAAPLKGSYKSDGHLLGLTFGSYIDI
jgi:long-chain fatty acid transport protein